VTLLNWFTKKPSPPPVEESDSQGMGANDATLPMNPASLGKSSATAAVGGSNRRNERQERREMLYAVVRECMTQAGVLSQSYKFKVLSLDSHGRQYLVMMDLPQDLVSHTQHFSEIETNIARNAKTRHDLVVSSVYWRLHEQVTANTSVSASPHHAVDPNLAAEMDAFKKSIHQGATAALQGELLQSGARRPNPMPQFADTEINPAYASPLSSSQFGGLN
jgi:hypothetical protein